jgi:3-oxoacyl-[acyl-carrier protein] reductase
MKRRCALITGGTAGIGKAVAECLAEAGYDIVLTYRSDKDTALAVTMELMRKYGINACHLREPSTRMQSITNLMVFFEKLDITLDAVVLNAAETNRTPFENITPEEWERTFFVNVHFPVYLLQRLLPRINAGGSVVFTGSLMGIHPHATSLAYGVSKAAVHALTTNLVKFLKPYSIRVNAVAPGFVDTGWQKHKAPEIRRSIEGKIAAGRFATPEEIAPIYRMIIENPSINGEIIAAHGGYSYK